MTPALTNVFRLDSLPLNQTYYTDEGYLIDRPIVTTTGIFEYMNSDGSVRRELRLPEEVFSAESLKSYKAKPVIVTHRAGLVTKDNVSDEEVGTILSEGYRSGDNVRAEIVIHDTKRMKEAGYKELSLGYNLDLDETPGEWNGQHYDAIQRNIRINHLALVEEARAGEQARLNIDSRDKKQTSKGESKMKKKSTRADSIMNAEQLSEAIEKYKAMKAEHHAEDAEDELLEQPEEEMEVKESEEVVDSAEEEVPAEVPEEDEIVSKVEQIKENNDEDEDPEDIEAAKEKMERMDEDMSVLFDIIDTLLAERDFKNADSEDEEEELNEDEDEEEMKEDEDDEELESPEEEVKEDEALEELDKLKKDCGEKKMNADSVDKIVRERIRLGMIGQKLNLDGLEMMGIIPAKKAIIKAIRPTMNLDGKSSTYVNAAFDMAIAEAENMVKDTSYQKRQMFNRHDSKDRTDGLASMKARQRMIEKQHNR